MKKLLLIPTAVSPYLFCAALALTFITGSASNLVVSVFGNLSNVCILASFVCNFIYILLSKKNTSASELVRLAVIIKAIHIPTYIAIFILGLLLGLMFIMTFPLILLLILIDAMTFFADGMISIYALAMALKEKNSKIAPLVIAIICQFFYCADVIGLFIVHSLIVNDKLNDNKFHKEVTENHEL